MGIKSNIIKKKQPNYINGLKAINNWFFSNNRKLTELEKIVEVYKIDNNFMKRFLLFIYNTPHLVLYINKYLNHIYEFNKFNTIDLLYSLSYLLDINRIVKKSIPEKLLYLKNTEMADKNRQNIKELMNEFFDKCYDKIYNVSEMNYFYDLVKLNIITLENINEIDKYINNGKSTLKLEEIDTVIETPVAIPTNSKILDIYKELPEGIRTFNNQAKEYILIRDECKQCELYGKPSVIIDTNMIDGGDVDIAFIGLNPGTEEVEVGKPFVGKAGKILRERMSLLPNTINWVIYNIILCHTKNESEIKKPDEVKNRCRPLVEMIKQTFPSKIYVPMGAKAFDWFGLKGPVSSIAGKTYTNNNTTIIPIIHPSAANYNAENLNRFKNNFQVILDLFKINVEKKPEKKLVNNNLPDIVPNKFITTVTTDLTFFDVVEIDNEIINIYIDQNGNKKYLLNDYKLSFFLKNSNWNECNQITDQIDAVVTIHGKDKYSIIRKINNNLKKLKGA